MISALLILLGMGLTLSLLNNEEFTRHPARCCRIPALCGTPGGLFNPTGDTTMKKTMHIVITKPIDFAKGDYDFSVSVFPTRQEIPSWINVGPVEIDFSSVDLTAIYKMAVDDVDLKIIEAREAFSILMGNLEDQRNSLMSLTYNPEGESNE